MFQQTNLSIRNLCMIAFFFLFTQLGFSQNLIDTFDIATYARPDLRRVTKSIAPRLFISNDNSIVEDEKDTQLLSSLSFTFIRTKFVNTEKTQFQESNTGGFFLRYEKENRFTYINSIRENVENHIRIAPSWRTDLSKKYFDEEQRFWEIGLEADGDYNLNRFKDIERDRKVNQHRLQGVVSVPLFRGKGRIELVSDAWHAIQILDFLKEQNLIKRNISNSEIHDFATKISNIKNFRNTDSRLESIAEFEALTAHLVDNKMVDPTDYRFFAHLQDAWRYESFVNRFSGKEFKYGIVPSFSFDKLLANPDDYEREEIGIGAALGVEFNKYTPKSKVWQVNQYHSFYSGYHQVSGDPGVIPFTYNELFAYEKIAQFYTVVRTARERQFLPNQRTNYFLNYYLEYEFDHNIINEQFNEKAKEDVGIVRAGVSLNYQRYLSPKWTVSLRSNFRLEWFHLDRKDFRNINQILLRTSYRFY